MPAGWLLKGPVYPALRSPHSAAALGPTDLEWCRLLSFLLAPWCSSQASSLVELEEQWGRKCRYVCFWELPTSS